VIIVHRGGIRTLLFDVEPQVTASAKNSQR
jgi:hypothetical protein